MYTISIKELAASRTAWIVCLGVITLMASVLGGLIWVLRTPDGSLPDFRRRFEAIRALEAHWDTEILSLQLGIAPNYDAVTHASRDIKVAIKELREPLEKRPALAPLQAGFVTYAERIERKDMLAEQVKASYAMLRNAVSVLPSTISDAFGQPDVLQPAAGTVKRMSDLITEVITGMVSFTTSPTPLLRDTVQTRVGVARAGAARMSPELRQSVERFLVQVEVAIKERQRGNDLMLALTSVPTDTAAAALDGDLQRLEAAVADRTAAYWYMTAALGALLFLAFIGFVAILRYRFSKLAKDNRMLQEVNEVVEEKLLQSAKLSALGQMVAGITHEINTPLAYVKAVFELIKERVLAEPDFNLAPTSADEDDDSLRERREEMRMLLDDGIHGLDEMATLVRTMKNFSRMDKGHIESFSVEEGIESALLIARPQLKYVADVRTEFDAVPNIIGSPSQLRQVLLNLIVNAADAMAEMGRRGVLTLRTRITSSDMVQIDVCDNGPGMSEEQLGKIFDPFYTTKPVGKGSGMGLSICYRIIENHGGTITVNSKPGKGAIFTITLPRQDEKHAAPELQAGLNDDSRGPAQVA